jgi:hypothetical protein
MKVILSGHENSKRILGASSFLVAKYLGDDFDIYWLNYGPFGGMLYAGEYICLDEYQDGVESWAADIAYYLGTFDDPFIIFALDDYLLNGPLDILAYHDLLDQMKTGAVCARLCRSDFYRPHECISENGFVRLTPQAEYSATTQYCIWDRRMLIETLNRTSTPWTFEHDGSRFLNQSGRSVIGRLKAALPYHENSSLSNRWQGVNVAGLNREDIETLIERELLNPHDLVKIN